MADMMDPLAAKNVVDASSKFRGGLESLEGLGLKNLDNVRAKSGLGERQLTEAASDVKSIDDATASLNKAEVEADAFSKSIGFPQATETSPLMSKLENRVQGIRDKTEAASGIMETVPKGRSSRLRRAASREFLVNSLKVGDDYPSTTLTDVMSAEDMKFVMEGGGGVMGDPISSSTKIFWTKNR